MAGTCPSTRHMQAEPSVKCFKWQYLEMREDLSLRPSDGRSCPEQHSLVFCFCIVEEGPVLFMKAIRHELRSISQIYFSSGQYPCSEPQDTKPGAVAIHSSNAPVKDGSNAIKLFGSPPSRIDFYGSAYFSPGPAQVGQGYELRTDLFTVSGDDCHVRASQQCFMLKPLLCQEWQGFDDAGCQPHV